MAAALVRRVSSDEGKIRPTILARDLYQIAQLVEICFGPSLDANGRASISEMKAMGSLGPLLWIIDLFETIGLGLGKGFVWRAGGKVVGNVSVYSGGVHPWLGRGWLIANVAVHPTFQRRGIARTLMQAAMNLIRDRQHGKWVALEVEADNQPAIALYKSLGFETFETLNHWETSFGMSSPPARATSGVWSVRPRMFLDYAAETDLIFNRARIGAMAWTQTISRHDVQRGILPNLPSLADTLQSRWVLPDPARPEELLGALWAESASWRQSRFTLFLDPALSDPAGRQALLRFVLSGPDLEGRTVRVETTADDSGVEEMLRAAGMHRVRSLTQMRYQFGHR
jgi:ribosomal protein S18 acetylase RimI-like enzyme